MKQKGTTMDLLKGQKMKLADLTPSSQIELRAAVQMRSGEADVTCFGVDGQSKLSDDRYFIFYNQTSSPEQAITMRNDGGSTVFSVDLKKLPPFLKKLVVTVAVDEPFGMKDLESGLLSIGANGQALAQYRFAGSDFQQEKALILCELYEKDGIWRMAVVSGGFNGGLSALLEHFGGEEVTSGSAPTPQQEVLPTKTPLSDSGTKPVNTPEPASQSPVKLKKSGDSHKISLTKNNKEIHVNLNWNTGVQKKSFFDAAPAAVDLDLACMYKLKTGEMGVIQALGNSFGSADRPPYIFLDQDDRTGTSQDGENMWFKRPETIAFAIVFAYIYEGTPNWKGTDASVILKQQGAPDIEIHLDDCANQETHCVIASLEARGDELVVKREERFFTSHQAADRAYGFGFRWREGRK